MEEAGVIRSVSEAIDLLSNDGVLKDIRPAEQAKRGDTDFGLWFRGHSSCDHVLVPAALRDSIGRTGRYLDEVSLVRHFKAINCDALPSGTSDFNVLVTMQHYLAPTRLLDWTENLLVALYFAVRGPNDGDSALWILNARRLNYYASIYFHRAQVFFENELDVIVRSALSRIRNRQEWLDVMHRESSDRSLDGESWRIKRLLNAITKVALPRHEVNEQFEEANGAESSKQVGDEQEDPRPEDENWASPSELNDRIRMPVAVYPNRSNRRIRVQSGCFTLHGGKFLPNLNYYQEDRPYPSAIGLPITLYSIDRSIGKTRIIKGFRIANEKRQDMRRALERIGVSETALFPELDYQSRYLQSRWTFSAQERGARKTGSRCTT
jgi:FRG domain